MAKIPKKTYYYKDALTADFAATNDLKPAFVNDKYNYFKDDSIIFNVFAFIIYYIVAKPACWLINKICFSVKIKNKKIFKQRGKKGCFIYSNHTNYLPDALLNSTMHSGKNYVIVGPQTVNIIGIRNLVAALGAIPLGSTIKAKKNFMKVIEKRLKQNASITIYPEAHIWPFYTGIRKFIPGSMAYPCQFDVPSFTVTICYQKRKISSIPKIVAICDGPFYPDQNLPKKERQEKLRDDLYNAMVKATSEYSNYEYYKYIQVAEDEEIPDQISQVKTKQ